MAEPHTLRGLRGGASEAPPLSEAVLIMVDCQNTYTTGLMRLAGVEAALEEAARLLAQARAASAPVIHIAHDAGPGSPYDISAEIGQIHASVAPQGDEPTVVKAYPNSFVKTDLEERLAAIDRKNVVLAGFMTHMCINSTARGAFNLGYACTVVGNATATRDLPGPDGGVVEAAALHRASLAGLADLFAQVVPDAAAFPE